MSPRNARIALTVVLLAIYATLGAVRPVTNYLRDAGHLRLSVAIAFAVAATVVFWLILRDERNRTLRTALLLLAAVAAYAAVILPMDSPEEKIHFIEYGVVGVLATASMPRGWSGGRRFIAAALFVATAGWIDEGIQGLLPDRYYDLRDVAFNAAAGLMALTAMALCFPRDRSLGTDRHEAVAVDAVDSRPRGDR
jgi:hypothetical protein